MWASSSCLLLAAAQRDLFQAPVSPGFLAPPVSSAAYAPSFQTLSNEPASFLEDQPAAYQGTPSTAVLATASVVALFAVAGFSFGQRSGGAHAPPARVAPKAIRKAPPKKLAAGVLPQPRGRPPHDEANRKFLWDGAEGLWRHCVTGEPRA